MASAKLEMGLGGVPVAVWPGWRAVPAVEVRQSDCPPCNQKASEVARIGPSPCPPSPGRQKCDSRLEAVAPAEISSCLERLSS